MNAIDDLLKLIDAYSLSRAASTGAASLGHHDKADEFADDAERERDAIHAAIDDLRSRLDEVERLRAELAKTADDLARVTQSNDDARACLASEQRNAEKIRDFVSANGLWPAWVRLNRSEAAQRRAERRNVVADGPEPDWREPGCSCPAKDITGYGEIPGGQTIRGLDPNCAVHRPSASDTSEATP